MRRERGRSDYARWRGNNAIMDQRKEEGKAQLVYACWRVDDGSGAETIRW
jgi:hypothetical protein